MTGVMALEDEAARKRIREDLDASLVVEAAAGTGKTTALVSRLAAVLRAGRGTLRRIVALTFTEKAAGEMKLRLREEIERARKDATTTAGERAALEHALSELEVARIGTIHAFCADLLHDHPVEARVDPSFDVMADDEAHRTFDAAFDAWFQAALADPPEGVRRMLRRRPRGWNAPGPKELLRDAAWKLADHRDFDGPWRRDPFDRAIALDRVVARMAGLDDDRVRASRKDDWLAQALQRIHVFAEELRHLEAVRGRDHDGLEAELREALRWREWNWTGGRGQSFGPGLPRVDVVRRRDSVKEEIERTLDACDADLAALLHAELRPVVRAYEAHKARAGKLDFLDLLLRARDLVAGNPAVRSELQTSFSHLFVDEFQDTDPLQAEILLLLAADDPAVDDWTRVRPVPGKLFVVGDPKQSIYRFRRADVVLYEETKGRLLARGAELVHLTSSFRSAPSIQKAVNAAFEVAMAPAPGSKQASYVPLAPTRQEPSHQPTIVALPAPEIYGDYKREPVKWKIEESYPDVVGGFVDWLVSKSGWTVTERSRDGRVPIEARHVCLLLKRFRNFGEDVTRPYVRALEARRIPHVLVGGRSFHDREEIMAIRSALHAIEWPDDDLSVYATLRGPFFAIHDDVLLAWKHRVRTFHPFAPVDPRELPEALRDVAAAMEILRTLHRGRNRRPVADTVARLLEATRAHAGLANWPSGEQVLANVLRVLDLARRFESSGATSFRAFALRLDEDAARGEAAEAPVVEEGTEGVRIMTVHRAKGLEFPVVILAEPTAPATFENPSRHVVAEKRLWVEPLAGMVPAELAEARGEVLARDAEEAVRLLYVASTRARDLLVVPVVGDEEVDGWVAPLHPIVYPAQTRRRSAKPAVGCPAFGDDSVLQRPPKAERGASASVAPGLHLPRAGEHEVVWWDPKVLGLGAEHDVGLRQQRILESDASGVGDAGAAAHEAWQARRAATIVEGSVPSVLVRAATEVAATIEDAPDVAMEETDVARTDRPHGKRFGALVHAILAAVDLVADDARLAAVASMQGRQVGATEEEVAAAAVAVRAALGHPLLMRAAASGDVRREAPVVLRRTDGTIVEGVIDLAFRESGRWTVVDFKTDVELSSREGEYRAQVALYCEAITAATGEPATAVLLRV